jgi:uncharacterized protein (TIGR00661 family)
LKLNKGKNILICPLEWGLGHAGRMIPVAIMLQQTGHNVFIGSGEKHLEFFRKEVPGLTYILFPGFRIRYSSWLPQYIVIFLTTPVFILKCITEHLKLKKIIREYSIDVVISDSRLGLWNKNITTALVTHMMRIPHPRFLEFLENFGNPLVKKITGKFDLCLIPDFPGEINISGKLSHDIELPENARFVGPLSRFKLSDRETASSQKKYYCTVILSGPEPQREILKKKLTGILINYGKPSVILEGKPSGETVIRTKGNITFISHLATSDFRRLILESENIVARSGYTTVMELLSLEKGALLIPTPGQPEQEYLAEYLSDKGWFDTISQKKLSGEFIQRGSNVNFPRHLTESRDTLLREALKELLEK